MNELINDLSIFAGFSRQNKMNQEWDIWQEALDNIKAEVKRQGYTYEEFADLFGHAQGWFSHIMGKRTKLTIPLLYELAEKLGVSPASLLPGENPTPKADLADFFWDSIKEKLDKYFEEKFKELLKKK